MGFEFCWFWCFILISVCSGLSFRFGILGLLYLVVCDAFDTSVGIMWCVGCYKAGILVGSGFGWISLVGHAGVWGLVFVFVLSVWVLGLLIISCWFTCLYMVGFALDVLHLWLSAWFVDIRFVSLLLFVVGFGFADYCVALWVSLVFYVWVWVTCLVVFVWILVWLLVFTVVW